MFENFPKNRIKLPDEYRKIYEEHYINNRNGKTIASGASQYLESWMHKKISNSNSEKGDVLEIGAGSLNHLKYEINNFNNYDIIEPFVNLYKNSEELKFVRDKYNDISEIPSLKQYKYIVSIATFEHICNLPYVVAKSCKLMDTENNSYLKIAIPNEGHLLWELGYSLTTGLEFKIKYGLNYKLLMNYEHVNNADEIENILKYFYENVECFCLGINKCISLYRVYFCKNPKIKVAEQYIEKTD